ncbi:sulfatase-like hydrolase/transferase [Sphingomonas sp. G-3-2-10]|nr:sulfatase-like hydrolase/transferase [Sphingomonas sp. G-3-2-10]
MARSRGIRRAIGATALALALAAPFGAGPISAKPPEPVVRPAAKQPNILFILVDDMGFGDLSLTGNRLVATPNIDALAGDGMVMSQFYDAAPICSPSRAAFMTGQFPAELGFTTYIGPRKRNRDYGQVDWLDPRIPTLPRALHGVGYATGHFGKWHLGGGRDVGDAPLPAAYGFDESVTQFEGLGPRLLENAPVTDLAKRSAALGGGPIEWMPRSQISGRFIDKALDFVARHKDRPWYVQLWLEDVHTPWEPSPEQLAAVKGKGRNPTEDRYLAVLVAMDAGIGRMIGALREAGELDDTLIVFTSDNGPTRGDKTPGLAGPWRGRKSSLYEGGVRQPLILRWPGHIRPGSSDAASIAHATDLFPTLARIGGAARPSGVDGIDIAAAWRGSPVRARPDIYTHIGRPRSEREIGPLYSIRSGSWKLMMDRDGSGVELYNLTVDPGELHNLAARETAVTRQLSARLARWIAGLPQPGPEVGR